MKINERRCGGLPLCVLAISTVCLTLNANVAVRTYVQDATRRGGGTEERLIHTFEASPYFATSPMAVSFAPKFEAPSETWDVVMFRLNLLVGRHRAVYALDVGALGNLTDYKMDGIGIAGLFNSVGESDGALNVAGIFNFVAFDFNGCQISGFYSCTEGTHRGLQIGLANYAGDLVGVQIGVANTAERLNGVQIGIVNYNMSSRFSVLPIANASF